MSRHLHYHNSMDNSSAWKYLARKPKSAYKQLFVKDRWVAARTLYGQSLGEDARTPPQLAADYALPLEVVLEAIAYCESDPPEIQEDYAREQALSSAIGTDNPTDRHGTPQLLSPQVRAKINCL